MIVVLYSRPRCGLCDKARAELLAVQQIEPFELREINVEDDDALERAYGLRIPVVELDGRELFEISVDPAQLLAELRA